MGRPDEGTQAKLTTLALATWAVGVQTSELIAAIGCYSAAALVLLKLRPKLPLVVFLGWGALISLVNTPTFSGAARLCDWLLIPVAALAVTRAKLRPVAIAALATAMLSCLVAGLQSFGWWPPLEFFAPLSFTRIHFERVYEQVDGRLMAGGLAFHRLKFAAVTSLVVIAAAAHRRWVPAALGFFSVLFFPAARAASLSLAVALTTLVRWKWAAIALAAALSVVVVQARDLGERPALLSDALESVAAHPIAGVGLGRFHPREWEMKAHNQWLTYAVEGGIPLALLFSWLLGSLGWQLRRSMGGLASLVFFVLLSLLHDPLFHTTTSQAVMLSLGCFLGLTEHQPDEREAQLRSPLQVQAGGDPRA